MNAGTGVHNTPFLNDILRQRLLHTKVSEETPFLLVYLKVTRFGGDYKPVNGDLRHELQLINMGDLKSRKNTEKSTFGAEHVVVHPIGVSLEHLDFTNIRDSDYTAQKLVKRHSLLSVRAKHFFSPTGVNL